MELQTFSYTEKTGWSIYPFPNLNSENTLVLIFCAPEYIDNFAAIDQIVKFYSNAKIIGCSTAGEIFGPNIYDNSLSVAVVRFDNTEIKAAYKKISTHADSYTAGFEIAQELSAENLKGIFVLSEGLNLNGSELIKGLNVASNKDKNVVITGGLAGDGIKFNNTWVIYQNKIYTNTVVAIGFYGDHIKIGHSSRGGWDIFGPERHITRSKNNILYELDQQPVLDLYKKYLGERASDLPASGLLYPLAIRKNSDDKSPLVRTILAVDEKEQALIFAGDMPEGYLAQLMRANFDRLIVSAADAGEVAVKSIPMAEDGHPILCIAISCVGRRMILGQRTEEETESVIDSMPKSTKQIGFYSYGELSPYSSGKCDLHNQTMTVTVFYES